MFTVSLGGVQKQPGLIGKAVMPSSQEMGWSTSIRIGRSHFGLTAQ